MATEKPQANKRKVKRVKSREGKSSSGKEPHAAPETGGPVNFYADNESREAAEHKSKANITLVARPPD